MSFQYGHFGTGFDVMTPTAEALRFGDLLERRGVDVTVVKLVQKGEDSYGQPVYTESPRDEKAFVERDEGERILPPGSIKEGLLKVFLATWAAIGEEGYEVEVDGVRYYVVGLDRTRTYIEAEAERKA
ncbi:MAG: hypothetical protein NWF12_01555 [Candidatus Bathyarchaeota archaeon]|nr:hypothetical protein [Candidatus Bathyarchaeota archaeon]